MILRIISLFAVGTLCAGFSPLPATTMPNSKSTMSTAGDLGRRASADDSKNEDAEFQQLKISFVTVNEMKRREVNTILNSCGATKGPTPDTSLVDLRLLNVDLPEIQEINTEAIAKNKAIQAAQLANGPCVVEDTSLAFNALGGMPGPFIKFFQVQMLFFQV